MEGLLAAGTRFFQGFGFATMQLSRAICSGVLIVLQAGGEVWPFLLLGCFEVAYYLLQSHFKVFVSIMLWGSSVLARICRICLSRFTDGVLLRFRRPCRDLWDASHMNTGVRWP